MRGALAEYLPLDHFSRDAVDLAMYEAVMAGEAPPNSMETREGWFVRVDERLVPAVMGKRGLLPQIGNPYADAAMQRLKQRLGK